MQIKKMVYFTKPGEKVKLNQLVKDNPGESKLAIAIEREFNVSFNDAMTIAQIWLDVTNNLKA